MILYAKTSGGQIKDCVFDCSIHVRDDEKQEVIDQIMETGKFNFLAENVDITGLYWNGKKSVILDGEAIISP